MLVYIKTLYNKIGFNYHQEGELKGFYFDFDLFERLK
ncbi:hypothetical protein TSL1_21600 [Sulfurovum sp. TSL1]|nr:hypothetical protein TSL1_21600 [Sulfurovum sp. TSL1]